MSPVYATDITAALRRILARLLAVLRRR